MFDKFRLKVPADLHAAVGDAAPKSACAPQATEAPGPIRAPCRCTALKPLPR